MSPPPEKPEAVRARTYVILSFWAVIILLGLPAWWKTTSIPRAALPVSEMLNAENVEPPYIVTVRVAAPNIPCQHSQRIVTETQAALDQQNEFKAFKIEVELTHFSHDRSGQKIVDKQNECGATEHSLGEDASALDVELIEGQEFALDMTSSIEPLKVTFSPKSVQSLGQELASSLRNMFADEHALVAYHYVAQNTANEAIKSYFHNLPQETIQKIEYTAALAFKSVPNYHLTFSLFTARGTPTSWDIEEAIKHYIQPLVHSLASVAKISTTSQVQMYSPFSSSIQPFEEIDEDGWFLREQDLTAFINTAEWPLSPSIGTGPTINFILYVPEKSQLPLRIEGDKGGSWIIPQWGGITILNPPLVTNPDTDVQNIVSHLDSKILQPAFEKFRSQLLTMLGVPATQSLPLNLRLRSYNRLSGLAMYLRTASNLGSLARLSQRLNNIPIPHRVLELVDIATFGLFKYREDRALEHVRVAFTTSEKAFFDKSMVGQVYFPEEHKVAVYLPLLGPIGVPLVVALLRELKQMKFWR